MRKWRYCGWCGRALGEASRAAGLCIECREELPAAPDPFHRDRPEVTPAAPGWFWLATTAAKLEHVRTGDTAAVAMDDGAVREFVVRHVPWQLCGGEWVLGLEGVAGGYDLGRVRAVRKAVPA